MRHLRKNSQFRLTPPAPLAQASGITRDSMAQRTTLGIVINPRLNEPVIAVTDGDYVSIRSLMDQDILRRIGNGYHSAQREAAATFTGYPRVHTPDGVKPVNKGYGTALYSALCSGAHLSYNNDVSISMLTRGDGICSDTRDRSGDADAWWEAANKRGLTQQETEELESTEEGVDITDEIDAEDLSAAPRVTRGGRVVYVNNVNVDIAKEEDVTYDVFTYKSLQSHDLLVAEFVVSVPEIPADDQLRFVWNSILEDPDLVLFSAPEALLALDVRSLHEDAVNMMSLLYLSAGLSDSEVDNMRYRWEHDLDPGKTSRQQSLFRANAAGIADVVAAREQVSWSSLRSLP